ncbi:MAG: SH3 domain-containing protein [Pseudomonadota bacterium]
MRLVVLLVVVAAALCGGWWWWSTRDVAAERAIASAELQRASARVGLYRMLREARPFEFSDIVVGGRLEGGDWDFRAMLVRGGTPRAAYGQVRPICSSGLEDPECWQIAYLESQGSAIDVPEPDLAVAATPAESFEPSATPPVPVGDAAELGSAASTSPPPEEDALTSTDAPADPQQEAELAIEPVPGPEPQRADRPERFKPAPGSIGQSVLPEPNAQAVPSAALEPDEPQPQGELSEEPEDAIARFPAFPRPRPTATPEIPNAPIGQGNRQQGVLPEAELARQASRTEDRTGDAVPVPPPPRQRDEDLSERTAPAEPELTVDNRVSELGAPLPDTTHEVALPLINARTGPSTSEPIITTLRSGTPLALVELRAGWGRFVILEGEFSGAEGWAAMSLVEEKF